MESENKNELHHPFPESVLNCGGLIGDIMNYTLAQSQAPNKILAFAGALSFVSHCCARRFRTDGNGRPNLYILAVGWSGVGKSFPRKTNNTLAVEAGVANTVCEKIASKEALQDTLLNHPRTLAQMDEIEGLFRKIRTSDPMSTDIIEEMLETWEKSASFMKRRQMSKAKYSKNNKDTTPDIVYHPHLSLFATGVTTQVCRYITDAVATNGFFARLLFFDAGKRGERVLGVSFKHPDPSIILRIKNILEVDEKGKSRFDDPAFKDTGEIIKIEKEAEEMRKSLASYSDAQYNNVDDGPENALWARTVEKAEKLAMVFAVSDCQSEPMMRKRHWELASDLVIWSNREQIRILYRYAADNDFEDNAKKALRILEKGRCPHQHLLRQMKMKTADFKDLMTTLHETNQIIYCKQDGEELAEIGRGIFYALS